MFELTGELTVDKTKSVNKIGHALHCLNPVFKRITFSDKMKALCTLCCCFVLHRNSALISVGIEKAKLHR